MRVESFGASPIGLYFGPTAPLGHEGEWISL
jgi:hypothetical protein